jgi:hypothetical protein
MKPTNTHCGLNAEFLFDKASGTYSYHWALKVSNRSAEHSGDAVEKPGNVLALTQRLRILITTLYLMSSCFCFSVQKHFRTGHDLSCAKVNELSASESILYQARPQS